MSENTYTVLFDGKEYEYQENDHVSIDVTQYVMITGAYYTFFTDDVEMVRNYKDIPALLEFTMPSHDVKIGMHKQAAGLPANIQKQGMHMRMVIEPQQQEVQPEGDEKVWKCPACGQEGITGIFCFNCGHKRPE